MISTVRRCITNVNGNPRDKGETDLNDRPFVVVNEEKAKQSLIIYDRRNTITKLFENLQVIHVSVRNLVQSVVYSNACAKWVPSVGFSSSLIVTRGVALPTL